MQIIEVKNNLVKISYNASQENLILSGFVVIKDQMQSFIAQVIHLEADYSGNFAILKLLFNFDDNGVITNYNGSIPDSKCPVEIVDSQDLLGLLPITSPIFMGELAQQKTNLNLDITMFEQKTLVCSEREEESSFLIKNFASQLASAGKKVLIFDLSGGFDSDFVQNKIKAGQNFKLPLNYETINFIYEKGLDDAKAETKALIQDIFLEVQNYIKTLGEKFIPFDTFKNVVDSQYEETNLVELVLLKNKLLKYYESGVFAQEKDEFNALKMALKGKGATLLDLSEMEPEIQREIMSYAYSLIEEANGQGETYVILNLDNSNSDKKLLKQIFTSKHAYSIPFCQYSFKYLKELKQLSKNLILFAPIQQQSDFAGYNVFLSKLNASEFVVYGQATKHLPLIVKLTEIPEALIEEPSGVAQEQVSPQMNEQDLLDEQIRRDVDAIYTAPKSEQGFEQEGEQGEASYQSDFSEDYSEDLTEEDLDFIDDLNILEQPMEYLNSEDEVVAEPEFDFNMQQEIQDENLEQVFEQESFEDTDNSDNFLDSLSEVQEEEIIPVSTAASIPVYSADIEPVAQSDEILQGDLVMHAKYGKGTVEKLISYGNKTLCSINFDNVGRRLLDPSLAEIKKI